MASEEITTSTPDNTDALVNPGDAESALKETPPEEIKLDEKPAGDEETTGEEIDAGEKKPEGEKPEGEAETEDDVQEWAKDNEIKLPERVKTRKDLVAYLKESDQKPTDERISRLEKVLAKQGITSVEQFLEQAERYQPQAGAEETTKAPVIMTATDVMKEFKETLGEDVDFSNPNLMMQAFDKATAHNATVFGREFAELRNEISTLKQTAGSMASFADQGLYDQYKAAYKEASLSKAELDKNRAKFPELSYDQIHAYTIAKDPKRFQEFIGEVVKNEISKRDKGIGREKKEFTLRADGRSTSVSRRPEDYLAPGGGWKPGFYDLSNDEQRRLSVEALKSR